MKTDVLAMRQRRCSLRMAWKADESHFAFCHLSSWEISRWSMRVFYRLNGESYKNVAIIFIGKAVCSVWTCVHT